MRRVFEGSNTPEDNGATSSSLRLGWCNGAALSIGDCEASGEEDAVRGWRRELVKVDGTVGLDNGLVDARVMLLHIQ